MDFLNSEDQQVNAEITKHWENDAKLINIIIEWQTQKFYTHSSGIIPKNLLENLIHILQNKKPEIQLVESRFCHELEVFPRSHRNNLRHTVLCLIASDQFKLIDPSQEKAYLQFPKLMVDIIQNDNEENGEIALEILNLPIFFKGTQSPLKTVYNQLVAFTKELIYNLKVTLQEAHLDLLDFGDQSLLFLSKNSKKNTIIHSKWASCRLLHLLVDLALSLADEYEHFFLQNISLTAWNYLKQFSIDLFQQVKNRKVFLLYINKGIGELLKILERAKLERYDNVQISSNMNLEVILRILVNLPPGTESLRLTLLKKVEHVLQLENIRIFGIQSNEMSNNSVDNNQQNGEGSFQGESRNNTDRRQLEWKDMLATIIDSSLMQGRSKPSADVQVSHAAILRVLGLKQVDLTWNQIQKVIRIICRSLLDNAVPLNQKSTLIFYLHFINTEYCRRRNVLQPQVSKWTQFEILQSLVELCKTLRPQLKETIQKHNAYLKALAARSLSPDEIQKPQDIEEIEKYLSSKKKTDEVYQIGEGQLLDAVKANQQNKPQNELRKGSISQGQKFKEQQLKDKFDIEDPENLKHSYMKFMWNLVANAELVFSIAREQRQQLEGRGSGTFLDPDELKLIKRFLIYGSEVIQGVSELWPGNKEERHTVKLFSDFFRRVRPLQLRDILNDVGPTLYASVVEAKTKNSLAAINKLSSRQALNLKGNQAFEEDVVRLVLEHFTMFNPTVQTIDDEYVCSFLETAFEFVSARLEKFNCVQKPGMNLEVQTNIEKRLAQLPQLELKETLLDITLQIGEQALQRPNDIKAKHIFFSVFVFCVKQVKQGALVADFYSVIIIRLFRILCSADNEGLLKEFLTMIQGLLETFLQSRDYVPYIEVTNHIFECMPAKLKSLLDYLPVISKPVVDSMKTVAHRDLERPLNTLQLWVSGLGQFPEILDPAINHVLPELIGMLYKILYQVPNLPFKLLGKLGAKSRPYWQDQEVSTRRFSEGGLKIHLNDKSSNREILLGIDAAIEVVLVKIFENPKSYSLSKLLDAFNLVRASLLCYLNQEIDLNYVMAKIIAVKQGGVKSMSQQLQDEAKAFDSSKRKNYGCLHARGSEAHAFEKILRSLLFACNLQEDSPETIQVGKKMLSFMKWVTKYFTLLYICKNGQLQFQREDEVNPLKFLKIISAFLLYSLRPGSRDPQQCSYFEGTVVCLETMLDLLNELFGDRPDILSELEITGILIKKVCHLAYEQHIRKKLALTFTLQVLMKKLPVQTIKLHSEHILDALIIIIHSGVELSVPSAYREYENSINSLFEKVGLFDKSNWENKSENDALLYDSLLNKLFTNLIKQKQPFRAVATRLIEKISRMLGFSVAELAQKITYNKNSLGQTIKADRQQNQQISWLQQMWIELEQQAKLIIPRYRGGYSKIQELTSYLEVFRFCLKHQILQESLENKVHTILGVAEVVLRILQNEAELFDKRRIDPDSLQRTSPGYDRSPGVESPSSCAQKYMRLEKYYISQNQQFDPYSYTQHPHELLTSQHFEVTYQVRQEEAQQPLEGFAFESFSFQKMSIFLQNAIFEQVDTSANQEIPEANKNLKRKEVESRIDDFIQKLIINPVNLPDTRNSRYTSNDLNGSRPSDINYDYVAHLYILYPNVQLRTELICRCLEFLCDILTLPALENYLLDRQRAFFNQSNQNQGEQMHPVVPINRRADQERLNERKLRTRMDFYCVEIRAKIITIFFKYFQREEDNILCTARVCLKRLLSFSVSPQDALPSTILKEGVRPALNVLSQEPHSPRGFKHLAMLIEVLHGCFNKQLGQHLLMACSVRMKAVRAPDIQELPQQNNQNDQRQANLEHEFRIVSQYNIEKVGSLETAKHIISILHLLPNVRNNVITTIQTIPSFELNASRELETSHVPTATNIQQRTLELRPIRIKFGVLKSDFRDGLAKYFNSNPVDCIKMLQVPKMINTMLEIIKEPSAYTIRERIARDLDSTIRPGLIMPKRETARPGDDSSFHRFDAQLNSVKLVWILNKFNPTFLCQPQHGDILESLRWQWVGLSEKTVDNCPKTHEDEEFLSYPEAMHDLKTFNKKILKCLLQYCRNEQSEKQVLFDLLKGFSYQPIIDLKPLLNFFIHEVPKFSLQRKFEILEAALNKVERSRGSHEQRYAMFEFAFLPILFSCSQDFRDLYEKIGRGLRDEQDKSINEGLIIQSQQIFKLLQLIKITFFGNHQTNKRVNPAPKWRYIQDKLETSTQLFYEQFFLEILKTLSFIIARGDELGPQARAAIFFKIEETWPNVLSFLEECAIYGCSTQVIVWGAFTFSQSCCALLNYCKDLQDQPNISNETQAQLSGQQQSARNRVDFTSEKSFSERLLLHHMQVSWQILPIILLAEKPKECQLSLKQSNYSKLLENTIENILNFHLVIQNYRPSTLGITELKEQNKTTIIFERRMIFLKEVFDPIQKRFVIDMSFNSFTQNNNSQNRPSNIQDQESYASELLKPIKIDASFNQKFQFKELQKSDTARIKQSLPNLCRILIENERYFTANSLDQQNLLFEQIRMARNPQTLQGCELIIDCSRVLMNWIKHRYYGGASQNEKYYVQTENSQKIDQENTTWIFTHLVNLVQLNLVQKLQENTKSEVECLLQQTLEIARDIIQMFPSANGISPALSAFRDQNDLNEAPNVPMEIRIFDLNLIYILCKYSDDILETRPGIKITTLEFLSQKLKHLRIGESRCIILALECFKIILQRMQEKFQQSGEINIQALILISQKTLRQDLELCQATNDFGQEGTNLLAHERIENLEIVEDPNDKEASRKVAALREAKQISRCIPHFSARFADMLNKMADETPKGSLINQFKSEILTFGFTQTLLCSLMKVVCENRKPIVTDRPFNLKTETFGKDSFSSKDYLMANQLKLIDEVVDWEEFVTDLDLFNKESVMICLKFVAHHTTLMSNEQACQVMENVLLVPYALIHFKASDYIVEEVNDFVRTLLEIKPGQERYLPFEKQQQLVQKLLDRLMESQERKPDRKKETLIRQNLYNKIFETCVMALELQQTAGTDFAGKTIETLLICSRGRPVNLKHRFFAVFEKLNGPSIYAKLKYFFNQVADRQQHSGNCNLFVISQLLDFLLYNFYKDAPLSKLAHSAKLQPLSNPLVLFENLSLEQIDLLQESDSQMINSLQNFKNEQTEFLQMRLSDLLEPLSEVISINPTYHDDRPIADILFTEVFWQLWDILSRQEQQFIAESINRVLLNSVKYGNSLQQLIKPTTTFARTMLESIASIHPQIRLAPELLQFMAKFLNLWHVVIPILENHIMLCPKNERYVMALQKIYQRLYEEDYLAGMRRTITQSEETRTLISFGQHCKWEEINQHFSQYINFYAEQEGLYAHLDRHRGSPGKYSRLLPEQMLKNYWIEAQKQAQRRQGDDMYNHQATNDIDWNNQYKQHVENSVQDQVAGRLFPKNGPNQKISELDLRMWENMFIDSLKVLNQWQLYRDITTLQEVREGGNDQNQECTLEMKIELAWQTKDWRELDKYKQILQNSDSIRYQLYYIFFIIQGRNEYSTRFDDVFKRVIMLAHQEWESQLPNYVDRAQFESLIMFQQVVESSEGGRSMIREARNLGGNERLKELKAAIYIWRGRVPHVCESIRTWKEILENRNFIYDQIVQYIQPQISQQLNNQSDRMVPQQQEASNQNNTGPVEVLDICWNLVKLASVSRKHELPSLALIYQDSVSRKLDEVAKINLQLGLQGNESLKYERFKLLYERLKLEFTYNREDPQGLEESFMAMERKLNQETCYEPWQVASLRRLIAEFYLSQGKINKAQENLLTAISQLNRRDPKLWQSYSKLNEIVFEQKNDQQSLLNALKGLLCTTTLNQHKSRIIIPRILKLLRTSHHRDNQVVIKYIITNTNYMPVWIWIFWAPQLLDMLKRQSKLELNFCMHILNKLVRVYPQAAYYPLRAYYTFCSVSPHQLKELLRVMKQRNPSELAHIETIGKEFKESLSPSAEETLCYFLQGLEMNTFFNRSEVQQGVRNFLTQLYRNYLDTGTNNSSVLLTSLAPSFYADFINEETKEKCILKILIRLKNLKDFLLASINSRDNTQHMEELSPQLAHFSVRGIEIPGQHGLREDEPLPQRTVYLEQFESLVQRSGLNQRRVVFKGNNQKSYAFCISPVQDYQRLCSEERATQIKVLMNMIFQKHKETMRRGIKFSVPSKLVIYLSKLSQDDMTFQDFQETHDFLLQERGVDPEIALLLQIKWFKANTRNRTDPYNINAEQIKLLNKNYYQELVGKKNDGELCENAAQVPAFLLTSYFHRIFYNVDDLFLFKKRFTTYLATYSFFAYVFNQAEWQTLSSMSFCKGTGRITFNEPRLKSCKKVPSLFLDKNISEVEHLELQELEKNPNYMPFRLTQNFVEFIGQFGLHGLFAGVMTSCSLSLTKNIDKISTFLGLVLRDEQQSEESRNPRQTSQDNSLYLKRNQEYILFKIQSLSKHKKIIDIPRSPSDQLYDEFLDDLEGKQHARETTYKQFANLQIPAYMLEMQMPRPDMPEEFNKKVFGLIELATDDSRRSQMSTNWCPWF